MPVPYLPGWTVWQSFQATWDSSGLPYAIEMHVQVLDGRPYCVALTVQAHKGEWVDGKKLRSVPVATLLDEAVACAVMAEEQPNVSRFKNAADWRAYRTLKRPHRERERWQLTPEHLAEVLEVYERGQPRGVMEVARHFGKPRATASRWVQKARAEAADRKGAQGPRGKG